MACDGASLVCAWLYHDAYCLHSSIIYTCLASPIMIERDTYPSDQVVLERPCSTRWKQQPTVTGTGVSTYADSCVSSAGPTLLCPHDRIEIDHIIITTDFPGIKWDVNITWSCHSPFTCSRLDGGIIPLLWKLTSENDQETTANHACMQMHAR